MLPEPGKQEIARKRENKFLARLEIVRDQIIKDELNPIPSPERHKPAIDYFKHLATLSTGSIFLQILLLEKVFVQSEWKPLIAVSLISFTFCIIGTVFAQTLALTRGVAVRWTGLNLFRFSTARLIIEALSLIIMWSTFLLGMIALTTFVLKNLY